jgi:hypothetical protein
MERRGFKRCHRQTCWLVAALLAFSAVGNIERIFEKDKPFGEVVLAVD